MTDFERNSSNGSSKEQVNNDPLLELARLFGSKPEETNSDFDNSGYDGYQTGDYPVSENDLPAYPSWDESLPAGQEPAFFESMEQEYYGNGPAGEEEEAAYHPQPATGNGDYHTAASELLGYENEVVDEGRAHYAAAAYEDAPAQNYDDTPDKTAGWSPLWAEDVVQSPSRLPANRQPPVSVHDSIRVRQAFNPAEAQENIASPLSAPSFSQEETWEEEWGQNGMMEEAAPFYPADFSERAQPAAEMPKVHAFEEPVNERMEPGQDKAAYPFDMQTAEEAPALSTAGMQENNAGASQSAPAAPYVQSYGPIGHNFAVQDSLPEPDNRLPPQNIPDHNFAETLHDFDLTIQPGKQAPMAAEQRLHEPEVNTIGVEGNRVEYTGTFDLPPVDYENDAARTQTQASLEQEFADIFENTKLSAASQPAPEDFEDTHDAFFYAQRPSALENPDFAEEDNKKSGGPYDWDAPAAMAAGAPYIAENIQHGGKKRGYKLVALVIVAGLGATGAYFYFGPRQAANNGPVIIHAERGDVRVMPQNTPENTGTTPAPAVYNRVEGNVPANTDQKNLIDETETPLNIQTIEEPVSEETGRGPALPATEEQPPQSTESGLDQASVTDMVMAAAAKTLPIHVVPTIRVQQGQATVPVSPTGEKATVLVPGASIQELLKKTAPANTAAENKQPSALKAEEQVVAKPAGQETAAPDIFQEIVPPSVIPEKPEIPAQAVQPAVERTPAAAAATGAETFYVQIASARTREEAQKIAEDAKRRLGSALDQNRITVVPAVIPGRGSFYRVRIMTAGHETATGLCSQYKQASGLDCFVGR